MNKYVCLWITCMLSWSISAQSEIDKTILEAQGYLKQKNYKDAQIALQQAIALINNLMGKDLITALPTELNDMKANTSEDESNTGGMGMMGGGFTISRNYYLSTNSETSFKVNIVANSVKVINSVKLN